MRYEEWEPLYLEIVREFGYSVEEDREAAQILAGLLSPRQKLRDPESSLRSLINGKSAILLGPCHLSPHSITMLLPKTRDPDALLATVGEGTRNAQVAGFTPSMIFTDLDGFPESDIQANSAGAIAVIHAHGDNIPRLREWVPRFSGKVIPTCQCAPIGGVRNWGGFTDGDRAFCALRHFGAANIEIVSFDFRNPCGSKHVDLETKKRKLAWAERIMMINQF